MTNEYLRKLADEHALALEYTPMSTYHSQRKSYEAGALKMLELVFAALDAAPIYTHYDMDDALKPFEQLRPL